MKDDDEKMKLDNDVYEEILKRLKLLDQYRKKPRTEEEEEVERKRVQTVGENTFIAYEDLENLAKKGEEFFLPPNVDEDACLSCGDGHFYKGSLIEIRNQLQSALKAEPASLKLQAGLDRIDQEILVKPNLAFSAQKKPEEQEDQSQTEKYTSPSPFSTNR